MPTHPEVPLLQFKNIFALPKRTLDACCEILIINQDVRAWHINETHTYLLSLSTLNGIGVRYVRQRNF